MKFRKVTLSNLYLCLMWVMLPVFLMLRAAHAEELEVKAYGKDLKTATLNAQVVAVRTVMNDMLEKDFVKSHVKELRGIIAKADRYAESPEIVSQGSRDHTVELQARVLVKKAELTEALRALGAKIVASYREVYAQRQKIAENVLKKVFGEQSKLLLKSTATAPFNSAESKTEELLDENYLFGPPRVDTFSPGQKVVVSYHRDEESAKKDGYLVLVASSVPLANYADTITSRECKSDDVKVSGIEGLFELVAPLIPGNYELRLFNSKGEGECAARWGFTVTSLAMPVFSLERNVFSPGENMQVLLEDLAGYTDTQLITVKREEAESRLSEVKALTWSDTLAHDYNPRFGKDRLYLKAPVEEGEYSLLLRVDRCHDCHYYNEVHQRSYALAAIPFYVKNPQACSEYQVFTLPEYPSESALQLILTRPPLQDNQPYLRIVRQGATEKEPALYTTRLSKSKDVDIYKALDLYTPGDYNVELFSGEKEEQAVFTTGFRVVESRPDRELKPYLEVYVAELEFGSRVHFDYLAKSDWSDKAFICLVRADTPQDAVSSLKAAGNHYLTLNHRRMETFTNLETDGLEAGTYELRMFDRNDEQGRLQAVATVVLNSQENTLKETEEIETMLNELVSSVSPRLPDSDSMPSALLSKTQGKPPYRASKPQYDLNISYGSQMAPTYKLISEYTREEREQLLPKVQFIKVVDSKFKGACDNELNKKIIENARISYTLGRDSSLETELKSFGKSMLTEWAVPGGLEKMQTAFKIGFDAVEHGVEGLDAMSEGDYAKAAKEAALMMIKTTLNACGDADCFVGIVGSSEDAAAAYFGQLSDAEFSQFMSSMAKRVRTTNSDGKFANSLKTIYAPAMARAKHMTNMGIAEVTHKSIDTMMGVGSAVAESEADEGTESFMEVDNGVIKTNATGAAATAIAEAICRMKPECAMVVSTARLSYQAALAARDFVRDSSVISAYSNWQKFDGTDAEWLIKQGGVRGLGKIGRGSLLQQVRNVMAKTSESNAVTRSCLSDEHKMLLKNKRRACAQYGAGSDQCQSYKIKEDDFSDDEIWAYLKKQFEEWEKLEQKNSEYAEFSKQMLDEYKKLDKTCALDFKQYYEKHLQQKDGWGTSLYNSLTFNTDTCKDEKAMFEAFLELESRLDSEYQRVMPPAGKMCSFKSKKGRRDLARENICNNLHLYAENRQLFMQKLMEDVAYDACLCGVSMSVVDGKLYNAGQEPAERMNKLSSEVKAKLQEQELQEKRKAQHLQKIAAYGDTYKIGVAMEHIGRRDVLHCMCNRSPGHAAIGGGCGYSGGGKCYCMGVTGHTWYIGMSASESAKKACGYFTGLNDYVNKQTNDQSLKPMLSHNEIREKLISADEYLSLSKPNQCALKN